MSVKTMDEQKCLQLVTEWNEGGNSSTGKARSPRVDLCTGRTTSVVVVDDRIATSYTVATSYYTVQLQATENSLNFQ